MSTEYQVVYHMNLDKFHKEVQIQLDNGWSLQGGVAFGSGYFCQALVKEKEPVTPKDEPAGATDVNPSPQRATIMESSRSKGLVKKRGRPRKASR